MLCIGCVTWKLTVCCTDRQLIKVAYSLKLIMTSLCSYNAAKKCLASNVCQGELPLDYRLIVCNHFNIMYCMCIWLWCLFVFFFKIVYNHTDSVQLTSSKCLCKYLQGMVCIWHYAFYKTIIIMK